MSKLSIKKIDDWKNWDYDIVQYDGNVFHSEAWLNTISSDTASPLFIEFYDDKEKIGVVSGIEVTCGKGPERMLFCYTGIALKEPDADMLRACKTALIVYAKSRSLCRVVLKSYDYIEYQESGLKVFKAFKRVEFVIDLKQSTEILIENFSSNVKYHARRVPKKGGELKSSHDPKLLQTLFEMLNITKEIRTTKGYGDYRPLSWPFIEQKHLKKLLEARVYTLFYVESEGEIVSMQLVLTYLQRAYSHLAAATREGYKLGAPSFMHYATILQLQEEGYKTYNLGSVPIGGKNDGLKKFKESLGATLINMADEETNFLMYPLKLVNPVIKAKKIVKSIRMPYPIKKAIIKGFSLLTASKDEY
jgi:Acetyltransferase (GNAT) domain